MESATLRNPGSPDDRSHLRVRIPVRPDAVVRARDAVRRAAERAGLAVNRTDDLVVAVSEACTNAMEAQLRARVTAPIIVSCDVVDRTFEVQVSDRGEGFEPASLAARPPLADPHHLDVERGWGIQLMHHLVDELVFDVTGTGMCVRLRMAL